MKLLLCLLLTLVFPQSEAWKVSWDSLGVTSLVPARDRYEASLFDRGRLGNVTVTYKVRDGLWQTLPSGGREMQVSDSTVAYVDRGIGNAIELRQTFSFRGDELHWGLTLSNRSKFPVFIGDLAVSLPWKGGGEEPDEIFERSSIKHAFVSGDASFFYFTRFNGEAPYIMVLPDPGTPLEYYTSDRRSYLAYIRSAKSGGREKRGTWRQPHTGETLAPGESRTYGFSLAAADSYPAMRELLYAHGGMDTKIVPGMTVPRGQKTVFALRTRGGADSVSVEFPGQTRLRRKEVRGDLSLWEVEFSRLGENELTVWFDGGRKTYLEFFCSLPPKELILKRSSFLVHHQQFRDTGRWYDGLYGVYDMVTGELRGPDNPDYFDEQLTYFLASDDPILGKAPFVASKNAVWPDAEEVASLEYHLTHFVWGGLQRTDTETPYEYGVYGTPNWYINRHQDLRETQTDYRTDRLRTWRTYDYPHVFMLWWEMYKIARDYPELCHEVDAPTCLERAYQTARVFFRYPKELLGDYYEPFKWGDYNELLIPRIMEELERQGFPEKAAVLRADWERKLHYFVYEDRYPYRSEYAADRTAFESTYALARYGMEQGSDPEAVRDFMERQHYANLACRGVLENQWYLLGSDFFGSSDWSLMSYMARMGGWSVLDYGLRYADDPYDWIRLGYASYLGPFGLVNAGDAASDYGYWYPGKEKDGALGQAFTPLKVGRAWIGTEEVRGPWRYCGEGDLGMCAVTRTAATVLAEDPTFGWILYGGNLEEGADGFRFVPADGVNRRLYLVSGKIRSGISLDRGHWSETEAVRVGKNLRRVDLTVSGAKQATLTVERLAGRGVPSVRVAGRTVRPVKDVRGAYRFALPEGENLPLTVLL